MRFVVCNKYYFLNGGTERYLGNITRQFQETGHEVVPFSVAYKDSWASPYEPFFLRPPGDPGEIYLNQLAINAKTLPTLLGRAVYSFEARRKMESLLDSIQGADAAYLLNIYNYMSPSIIDSLRKRNIRTVMRLGDYNLICSNYMMLRDEKSCNLCVRGDHYNAVRYRCVHKSFGASAVRAFSMYVHGLLHVYDHVHAFVTPSVFLARRLVESGLPQERIAVLPQPADLALAAAPADRGNGASAERPILVYFGRLTREKGVDVLVEAFQRAAIDADLVIVGRSYDGTREYLQSLVREPFRKAIRFVEFLDTAPLTELVARAKLCVVPSIHPDNAPQAIVESCLNATPVLGADIGAIPELLVAGVTGETFRAGSASDLADRLRELWRDPQRLERLGRNAQRYARTRCSMSRHMSDLTALLLGAAPNDLGLTPDMAEKRRREADAAFSAQPDV